MCSYFIFDEYSEPYRVFARLVFPFGIFVCVAGVRDLWRLPIFQAVGAYLIYLLISGFWSDPLEWFLLGQKLTISIYLIGFIAITHYLVGWNHDLYQRMLKVGVLVAAVAALTSLVVFYRHHPFPGARLEGIGSLTNINSFSNVYAVFALLAMRFALQTQRLMHRVPLLLAILIFISIAWFGQSRTALLSMIIALLALMSLTLEKRTALGVAVVALVALMGALALLFPETVEQAALRGKGLRPQIWGHAWEQVKLAPIFGYGLIADISVDTGKQHFEMAHNAYLQIFWHGGVIGLGLFLLLFVLAFREAWSQGCQQKDFTLFCILLFTACAMMTGVDTLIARPRDQWMLFWFPLALLLSYQSMAAQSHPDLAAEKAGGRSP
jgi:O-antigen ligase